MWIQLLLNHCKITYNITIVNFPFENFITASSPASNFSWTHSLPADFKLSKALLANSVYSDSNASTSNQYGLSSRNIQRIYQNQLYSCESFYIIFYGILHKEQRTTVAPRFLLNNFRAWIGLFGAYRYVYTNASIFVTTNYWPKAFIYNSR